MTDYQNAIEIKGLTKKYDGFTLDNVSFDVPKGSIMGFIGQNGAGKTTTIRCLLNITKTDGGKISLLGMDHIKDEFAVVYAARTATAARAFCPPSPVTAHGHCPANYDILGMARQ